MDYYGVLEVTPKASAEVVKAAYLALAKQFNGDDRRMKQINLAWEVLGDGKRRKKYDEGQNGKAGGKVVGNYRMLAKIAEGGFGTTYKGEHVVTKMPVCIKHASSISPTDTDLFLEEARILWDLRHHGIPAVRDMLQMEDGSLALVMSYIPGLTLAQIVDNVGPLDPEHVCWITDRALNILEYLHDHGVIHGDVKPQNIIIPPDPKDSTLASHEVALVDYGLSLVKPKSTTNNKGYTPYFAAPEQHPSSDKPPVPETDIYGLGMTMIYALGGDVGSKRVPDYTPDELCKWILTLIAHGVSARPNPLKVDLRSQLRTVRLRCFGREFSEMKKLRIA